MRTNTPTPIPTTSNGGTQNPSSQIAAGVRRGMQALTLGDFESASTIATPAQLTQLFEQYQVICKQLEERNEAVQINAIYKNPSSLILHTIRTYQKRLALQQPNEDALPLLNLSGFNLSGMDLSSMTLDKIDFSGCDLSHTDLSHSTFKASKLTRATLQQATLSDVSFEEAELSHANVTHVWGERASFVGATCIGAHFDDAMLDESKWNGATIRNASMRRALLAHSDFSHCVMARTQCDDACFNGANMYQCDLSDASITNADMKDVLLKGTIMTGTRVSNASFGQTKSEYYARENMNAITNATSISTASYITHLFTALQGGIGLPNVACHVFFEAGIPNDAPTFVLDHQQYQDIPDHIDNRLFQNRYMTPALLETLVKKEARHAVLKTMTLAIAAAKLGDTTWRPLSEWLPHQNGISIQLVEDGQERHLKALSPPILKHIDWHSVTLSDTEWADAIQMPRLMGVLVSQYPSMTQPLQTKMKTIENTRLWAHWQAVQEMAPLPDGAPPKAVPMSIGDMPFMSDQEGHLVRIQTEGALGYPSQKKGNIQYLMPFTQFEAFQSSSVASEKQVVANSVFQMAIEETIMVAILHTLASLPIEKRRDIIEGITQDISENRATFDVLLSGMTDH